MQPSSSASVVPIEPYVLEFAVNFRWLLRYATQQLDPTVEVRYPSFMEGVGNMDNVFSRTTFNQSCTFNDLPYGALRLSREGALYLLVCDHLLGGCPPTMHPFLERAYGSSKCSSHDHETLNLNAQSTKASGATPSSPSLTLVTPREGRTALGTNADLNVVFPIVSNENNDDRSGDLKMRIPGTTSTEATSSLCKLDGKPVGTLNGIDAYATSPEAAVKTEGKEVQAVLLLLRWLFSEGVLSEEELAATLFLDNDTKYKLCSFDRYSHANGEELRAFQRHQCLAHRVAELIPFYLGAHVLISRSILLQYSATLLTTDGVMQHVKRLESPLADSPNYVPFSSLRPPSSVEGALLEWFQAIVDSTRQQLREEDASSPLLQRCNALRSFIEHGPFCSDVLDPSERDFFRLVQSGECVCIALWFYCPGALPLGELSRALHDAEQYMASNPAEAELYSHDATADLFQRHQSLCYWTAIFAAARYLGVLPLLSPAEVVAFGLTALPLHLFVFVQRLFAVLATTAEEEVRVSADTVWWEQMGNSDGYTELMNTKRMAKEHNKRGDDDGVADSDLDTSSSTIPVAQQVLRQSMRNSFLPEAFQNTLKTSGKLEADEGEEESEEKTVGSLKTQTNMSSHQKPTLSDNFRGASETPINRRGAVMESTQPFNSVFGDTTNQLAVTIGTSKRFPTRDSVLLTRESPNTENFAFNKVSEADARHHSSTSSRSSSLASSTHFTVEFAHTQRGGGGLAESSQSHVSAVEMGTWALRPMVRRRSEGTHTLVAGVDMRSHSWTDLAPVDMLDIVTTEDYGKQQRVDSLPSGLEKNKVDFSTRVVDTYARTPDAASLLADRVEGSADITQGTLIASTPTGTNQQKTADEICKKTQVSPRERGVTTPEERTKPPVTLLPLVTEEPFFRDSVRPLGQIEERPFSPQLPDPRKIDIKKHSPAFGRVPTVTSLTGVALQLSASSSSQTYTSDFVVQSGPADVAETPLEEAAVAVDKSASFCASTSARYIPEDELRVAASPLLPHKDSSDLEGIQSFLTLPAAAKENAVEENKEVPAIASQAAVAVKNSTSAAKNADVTDSDINSASSNNDESDDAMGVAALSVRDGNKRKESSLSTPSSASSPPSLPSQQQSPPQESFSSSATESSQQPAKGAIPPSESSTPQALLQAWSATPTHPLAAATAPTICSLPFSFSPTPAASTHNGSNVNHARFPTNATEAPHSLSVTDIAVEDDGPSTPSRHRTVSALSESFPTPTEREEANRLRTATVAAASDEIKNDISKAMQSQSLQLTSARAESRAAAVSTPSRLHTSFLPSPVLPDTELPTTLQSEAHNADPLCNSPPSHHTLSDCDDGDRRLDGLSPLTPALTQGISEVYGTDCASLLEEAAHSYGSLSQAPRSRQWDEESWFSSASHPHRQPPQKNGGSLLAVSLVRDASPVRELLSQLGNVTRVDLDHTEKEELRAALAQQQELVRQLASALQERARCRMPDVRNLSPAVGQSGRRRQVRLRSPSDEFGGSDADASAERQRSVGGSRMAIANRRGKSATPSEHLRHRSVSCMTAESQASPSCSVQTDPGAQLAETDVSSLLTDDRLLAESLSPIRAKPK